MSTLDPYLITTNMWLSNKGVIFIHTVFNINSHIMCFWWCKGGNIHHRSIQQKSKPCSGRYFLAGGFRAGLCLCGKNDQTCLCVASIHDVNQTPTFMKFMSIGMFFGLERWWWVNQISCFPRLNKSWPSSSLWVSPYLVDVLHPIQSHQSPSTETNKDQPPMQSFEPEGGCFTFQHIYWLGEKHIKMNLLSISKS